MSSLSALSSRARTLAILLGAALVALVAGASLLLAPVVQHEVTVTWPQNGQSAESTALLLVNQTPHDISLVFGPEDVAAAADGGGLLFATVRPERDAGVGMAVTVAGGELTVRVRGRQMSAPVDDRVWTVTSSNDGVSISAAGDSVQSWPDVLPPQVDGLLTGIPEHAGSGTLHATVHVLDDSSTSPSPVKNVLIAVVLLALIVVIWQLARLDRLHRIHPSTPRRVRMPRAYRWGISTVDVVVVLVLIGWAFIGPMTADDGYYALMSRNNAIGGFVGNYYQGFNLTFVPFVWYWQFFDLWQQTGLVSPVWLRLPSVLFAIASWVVMRVIIARFVRLPYRMVFFVTAVTGLITVVWWCAYAIGVRPEALAATATVSGVLLVLVSIRRAALLPAFGAAVLAGLAFAAHPVGIVAFAPVLLTIPALWRVALRRGGIRHAVIYAIAITSAGAVALVAAFHDGSLFEMRDSQARFSAIETPLTWLDEIRRYDLLLENGPQGSYAKRAVVLVTLVMLIWFVVAWVWDRRRGVRVMGAVESLIGWSTGLGFVLIWITSSKWSHHFGAMSALGALFVALMIVVVPRRVMPTLPTARARWTIAVIASVSFVPPVILALNGPQDWFSWNAMLPGWWRIPEVGPLSLRNLYLWILIVCMALLLVYVIARRSRNRSRMALFAPSVVIVVFFAMVGTYMFGTFAVGAFRGVASFSTAGAAIRDPLGARCLIEDSIDTWDASTGTALAGTPTAGPADATLPDGTPTEPITATGADIWSNVQEGKVVPGRHESPWFSVPVLSADDRIVVAVAGHLTQDAYTSLTLIARTPGGERQVPVTDLVDRQGWRTLVLSGLLPPETTQFQLVASSSTAVDSQWFAVSSPITTASRSFHEVFPTGTPVSLHWLMSFWFSCTTAPKILDGIVEPPAGATTWADTSWDMSPWLPERGGILAGASRLANMQTLASDMSGYGPSWGRVQTLSYPVALHGYDLTVTDVVTPGWRSAFPPASQLVEYDRTH